MKKIIDGATYNTDTATKVAEGTWEDQSRGIAVERELYQNRAGVYFTVAKVTHRYKDRYGDWQERESYEWEVVGDAAEARDLCEREDMTILQDIGDMPPEAEGGEPTATLYLRVPPALKTAVEQRAEKDGISVNTFGIRCLERCLTVVPLPKRNSNATS
jgi:hypothetical protein